MRKVPSYLFRKIVRWETRDGQTLTMPSYQAMLRVGWFLWIGECWSNLEKDCDSESERKTNANVWLFSPLQRSQLAGLKLGKVEVSSLIPQCPILEKGLVSPISDR